MSKKLSNKIAVRRVRTSNAQTCVDLSPVQVARAHYGSQVLSLRGSNLLVFARMEYKDNLASSLFWNGARIAISFDCLKSVELKFSII